MILLTFTNSGPKALYIFYLLLTEFTPALLFSTPVPRKTLHHNP